MYRSMSCSLLSALLLLSLPASAQSLQDLRKGHTTRLTTETRDEDPVEVPEAPFFKKVEYPGPLGKMVAWLSQPDHEGHKHPAILWITGGFPPGGIDSDAWEDVNPANDQSAKSYRENDMIMMYPWLRGAGGNPGKQESFYGEVDDVLAAARFLASQDTVDPKRIYLGGHSTGGTLALLAAACDFPFKAVLSFGPIADPRHYGDELLKFDPKDEKEAALRSPAKFISSIKVPTLIIEGEASGNVEDLEAMRLANKNPKLTFVVIKGADHFSILRPINDSLARQLGRLDADKDPSFDAAALQNSFGDFEKSRREASDLNTLAQFRASGVDIRKPQTVRFYALAREKEALEAVAKSLSSEGFSIEPLIEQKDRSGRAFYILRLSKSLTLTDIESLFACSQKVTAAVSKSELQYDGWDVKPAGE